MTAPAPNARQFLRLADVERLTSMRKTKIYGLTAAGKFPASIKLGARTAVWLSDEVAAWMEQVVQAQREPARGCADGG
ncbi:helix-turn-helix transcriptional regulator [Xenophilus aerolatus]|nr:AlpA family phage regulatory protein [Xenophilus aerolatus]